MTKRSRIMGHKSRSQLTHFLCIPLKSPQLATALLDMRNDILADRRFDVPKRAFRPAETIHFTLGVMSLSDRKNLQRACDALREIEMPSHPLFTGLAGLTAFEGSSKQNANVLFAKPTGPDVQTLQEFSNKVRRKFIDMGLVLEDTPKRTQISTEVVLHATIINTIYAISNVKIEQAPDANGERKNKIKQIRPKIDARIMLDKYADYKFMDPTHLERLEICKMGERKLAEGGGYEMVAFVDLP
ncbi:kinase A anchor protein [Dipodascopsis uninucleata]